MIKKVNKVFCGLLVLIFIVGTNGIFGLKVNAATSAPIGTIIEAENATYCSWGSSGSVLDSSWCNTYAPNASGLGLYNSLNVNPNYEFKITFNAPSAGEYAITVRYAKHSAVPPESVDYPITVNGSNAGTMTFVSQGPTWNAFSFAQKIVNFSAGDNLVVIDGYGSNGGVVMLDWIKAESKKTLVSYDFEDNTALAKDVSGNGSNGTVTTNVAQATGKLGNAANLTGGNIQVPMSVLQSATEFTLEYWVNPRSVNNGGYPAMIDFNDLNANSSRLLLDFVNGKVRPKIPGIENWGDSVQYTIPINQWTKVMLTYSIVSGKAKIYFNGKLDSEYNATIPITLSTNLYIGSRVGGTYTFDGLIDEFKIYNYAKSPVSEMIVNYNFEDNTALAKDVSGNGAFGTITGNVTQVDGKEGKAANFTGGNIIVPMENLQFSDEFTLEYWVNPRSVNNGDYPAMIDFNNTSFLFDFVGGKPRILNSTSGELNPSVNDWASNAPLDVNKWTHVALSYSKISGKLKLYFNGILDKEWSGMQNTITPSTNLYIGSRADNSLAFDGLIDEFKLYNYEKSYTYSNVIQTDSINLQQNKCIVTITNNTINNINADVIIGQYDTNQVLKDVYINNFNILMGTHTYEIQTEMVSVVGDKLKVFVWENINDIIPISNAFTN